MIFICCVFYLIQFVYNIYIACCITYFTIENRNFNKNYKARLSMFSKKWIIKLEDNIPKVYLNNKYIGELEYHEINNLKRIIKAGKCYQISCITGRFEEINENILVENKPSLDSLFDIGTIKFRVLNLAMMLSVGLLSQIPYFKAVINDNSFLNIMTYGIGFLFVYCYYWYVYILYQVNKKNKNKKKLKIVVCEENNKRYDLVTTGNIIVETIQMEYEKYVIKDNNYNDSDSDYLFYNDYVEYPITIYQDLTPENKGFFTLMLYLISMPIKGIYTLFTKRYKAEWYKRIRAYCPKITITKDIKYYDKLWIDIKEGYYDYNQNKYYPSQLSVREYKPIREEMRFNKHDIKFCYYEYVRQVISMPILFLTMVAIINSFSYRILDELEFVLNIVLLVFAIVTFILGIPHLKREYKRKEEIEEKLRRFEDYRKNNEIE